MSDTEPTQQIASLQADLAKTLLQVADSHTSEVAIEVRDRIDELVNQTQATHDLVNTLTVEKGTLAGQVLRARRQLEFIMGSFAPEHPTYVMLTEVHDILAEQP